MGEGGLQVVFAISYKNNLPDVSIPPFNVTDCRKIVKKLCILKLKELKISEIVSFSVFSSHEICTTRLHALYTLFAVSFIV